MNDWIKRNNQKCSTHNKRHLALINGALVIPVIISKIHNLKAMSTYPYFQTWQKLLRSEFNAGFLYRLIQNIKREKNAIKFYVKLNDHGMNINDLLHKLEQLTFKYNLATGSKAREMVGSRSKLAIYDRLHHLRTTFTIHGLAPTWNDEGDAGIAKVREILNNPLERLRGDKTDYVKEYGLQLRRIKKDDVALDKISITATSSNWSLHTFSQNWETYTNINGN